MKIRRYKQLFGSKNKTGNKIPTQSEMFELLKESNGICALSGVTGVWTSNDSNDPFVLTVDHIIPISKGGSSGKHNLQVVLRCVNRLKGDKNNLETIQFLNNLKSNSKQIIQQDFLFSHLSMMCSLAELVQVYSHTFHK